MNRFYKAIISTVVFSILVGLVSSTSALAATQGTSLTTSPVFLDLPIKPGNSSNNTLQVMNNTSKALTIMMELKIFSAYGSSGEAAITNAPAGDPSPSWVHFSPSTFVARPGVWTTVKMTISLPLSAQLGYYYAAIFQPVISPQQLGAKSTTIKGSNAILVLVDTQSPGERHEIQVSNFSVSKKIYEYLPATFNITMHNTGNIFQAPKGDIFISKNSNLTNTIDTIQVNAGGGNVLPASYRSIQVSWNDGFPVFQAKTVDGQPVIVNGKTVEQLKWNFTNANNLRLGKYYAQLVLLYNNGTREVPITSEVSFWVIPWKIGIVLLIISALLLLGLFTLGRTLVKRLRKVKSIRKK